MRDENYGIDIFQLKNPTGIVASGQLAFLEWIFKPIEAKEYHCEVPISIEGGKTKIVNFRGRGLKGNVGQFCWTFFLLF